MNQVSPRMNVVSSVCWKGTQLQCVQERWSAFLHSDRIGVPIRVDPFRLDDGPEVLL